MNRQECLDLAASAVNGERDEQYGTPENNFGRIAAIWTVIFGMPVQPWQVAAALAGVKIARLVNNPQYPDNWVDLAGYAACGAELTAAPE